MLTIRSPAKTYVSITGTIESAMISGNDKGGWSMTVFLREGDQDLDIEFKYSSQEAAETALFEAIESTNSTEQKAVAS